MTREEYLKLVAAYGKELADRIKKDCEKDNMCGILKEDIKYIDLD